MTATPLIKKELKKQLKRYYHRRWAIVIAEKTGFDADTVRRIFRSERQNEAITEAAFSLLDHAKQEEAAQMKKLES